MDLKQYRSKLIGSEDERAVSPVIGVILMVAITVILAAVIAAFVLDMGGSQQAPAQAGVSTDTIDASTTEVTIQSMGESTVSVECTSTGNVSSGATSGSSVGDSFTCDTGSNVIAISEDGNENLVQEDI